MEEKILETAIKSVKNSLDFKRPRLEKINKYEKAYYGHYERDNESGYNIHIPILEGFVQTLESKIDDNVNLIFKQGKISRFKTAKKIMQLFKKDSAPDRGNYASADLDAKKFAIFSGFGVLKLIPNGNPYFQKLEAVDYYDFIFDPLGPRNLEEHNFVGQINIIKRKSDLINGAKNGVYDKEQVKKLINNYSTSFYNNNKEEFYKKIKRYEKLGLGIIKTDKIDYSGDDLFLLTELYLNYRGERYYILFDFYTETYLKIKKLVNIFKDGLYPYVAWHFERNPSSFLCKSPLDSVYPVSEAMRIMINYIFSNIRKRNFPQIIYDADKIDNPAQLIYKPNGLIAAKLNFGESINNSFSKIETQDITTISVNVLSFLDQFIGLKTGVTPSAQGVANEDKVGIYFGNIEQVSDRFNLLNKFYNEAYINLGIRYINNLIYYLPDGYEIQMLGEDGYQQEKIFKEELMDEFSIDVSSSNLELKINSALRNKQIEALNLILRDQEIRKMVNLKWLINQILKVGEFKEEEIKNALDTTDDYNAEIISEASRAIEEILSGRKPKIYRRADTNFIRKIIYFATDKVEDEEIYYALIDYALQHLPIAERNAKMFNNLINNDQIIKNDLQNVKNINLTKNLENDNFNNNLININENTI